MKISSNNILILILLAVLLGGGCSGLILVGQKAGFIKIISQEEAAQCEKLDEITVKALAKLGKINRVHAKVEIEAENMARHKAVEINATAISPLTEMTKDGNQTFAAYDCH